MTRKSRDTQALTDALSAAYSGVTLTAGAARRMAGEILGSRAGLSFSALWQWLVAAAVALAALMAPVAAASQAVL